MSALVCFAVFLAGVAVCLHMGWALIWAMLLGIAAHVLKDNLSGFFADLPSVLNRAGKAAESDG